MKNIDDITYNEIFNHSCYQKFIDIEDGDFVLDLGCSQGPFFFRNRDKKITYMGVDASINCIKDFYGNLDEGDSPIIINSFLSSELTVLPFEWYIYDTPPREVNSITFPSLLKMINRKIDFLKFDIEAYEKLILVDHYDLFKSQVKKFAGEIHFGPQSIFLREDVYRMLENLKNDSDVFFKLYTIDGIDITDSFNERKNFFTEIIINGYIENQ